MLRFSRTSPRVPHVHTKNVESGTSCSPIPRKEVRRVTAQIATFVENQDAIRAYKKVGFSVAEERTDVAFQGVIGSRGMAVMKLDLEAL